MTDRPKHYPDWFEEAAEKWRTRLVPAWRIFLLPRPPRAGQSNEASSRSNAFYNTLHVWVNLQHPGHAGNRRALEESLLHEILHALFEPIDAAYKPALDQLGNTARDTLENATEMVREQAIEALARRLIALEYGGEPELVERGRDEHLV